MSKISTCLWVGKDAEMAVRFYVSLVPENGARDAGMAQRLQRYLGLQ